MGQNSPLNVRLDDGQRAWVKRYAHLLDWSENQIVREAINCTRQMIENPGSSEVSRIVKLGRAAATEPVPENSTSTT